MTSSTSRLEPRKEASDADNPHVADDTPGGPFLPESSAAPGPRLGGTELTSVPLVKGSLAFYLLGWGV
jgi:hypothetical protein